VTRVLVRRLARVVHGGRAVGGHRDAASRRSAEHRRGEGVLVGVGPCEGEHGAPTPEHGHVVGDAQRLAQLVGDDHDAPPAGREAAQPGEQVGGLLGREHGGWLVEDEHPRVAAQRLDDLHTLLRPHGERSGACGGVHGEADLLAHPPHEASGPPRVVPSARAERDVLGHGHRRDEGVVLVDHAEPGDDRVGRGGEPTRGAVHAHRAGVRPHEAERDAHERALPGAVLAEHRVHGARAHGEGGAVQREGVAEPLADPVELEGRRGRDHSLRAHRRGARVTSRWGRR
jgi:hypothetical protein